MVRESGPEVLDGKLLPRADDRFSYFAVCSLISC